MLVLLLFIVAVAFIFIELFLPGGIFGIMGALAFIGSIVLAFRQYPEMAYWIATGELLVAAVLIMIGIKRFPESRAGKLLILGRSLDKKLGYSGTESLDKYVGKEGTSMTHLRPAGIAKIDSRRLDVVTEGSFIDKKKNVKVVAVEGNRMVVREMETSTGQREDS